MVPGSTEPEYNKVLIILTNTISLIDQTLAVGDLVWEVFFTLFDYLISCMDNVPR